MFYEFMMLEKRKIGNSTQERNLKNAKLENHKEI
jgi:hypothetical protein